MSARHNAPPTNEWDLLRRLYDCNKKELAERLGITPPTLRRYEAATEAGEPLNQAARSKVGELLRAGLRIANNADDLLSDRTKIK